MSVSFQQNKDQLSIDDALHYIFVNRLDKPIDVNRCHFCETALRLKADGMEYTTEVGEWWSRSLQDSALAHPDCLPYGLEGTYESDAEWTMA
jgi:hypothetical protein